MSNKQKYKRFVLIMLVFGIIILGGCGWAAINAQIPEQVYVTGSEEVPRLFHNLLGKIVKQEVIAAPDESPSGQENAPLKEATILNEQPETPPDPGCLEENADQMANHSDSPANAEALTANTVTEKNRYQISCSLFGKIPLKTVSVSVQSREAVYVGGSPIGIYLETDGVLVVDTGEIKQTDGQSSCPAENIVKAGDYIQAVNGEQVTTKEELIACISKCQGDDVILDVKRADEYLNLRIQPVMDEDGDYRAGIWVRNDTQGIGTLTYIDQEGRFGALGHGISDVDTGELLDVSGGTLYDADVISIVKGKQGTPGEVAGVIHYNEGYKIGEITDNDINGIYGKVSSPDSLTKTMELYEAAYKQEVEPGKASILCSVDGTLQEYQVEIREIRINGSDINKGMVLEVTDPALLELTGGIVQGMSGSPILQNGRIVGAVTHVFVNDPTRGYGIFIENMLTV